MAYGGVRITEQMKRLDDGAEILVGTPGRIMDLQGRRLVKFDKITHVVLDEVDRMLDIGFRDDIRKILRSIQHKHQTIFVSATISDEIRKLAKSFMHEPIEINVSQDELTVDKINHGYVTVDRQDKMSTLLRFMKEANPTLAIVFTNMKVTARRVAEKLDRAGIRCVEIHGDLMQKKREKVLDQFRKAHVKVMVATDLASRGLDVMEISHIVNYDIPEDSAVYVHRIGRTARMGKSGYAVTFVQPDEGKLLTEIELLINREIPQFEEAWAPPRQAKPEPIEAPAPEEVKSLNSARYLEPVSRCTILESHGIKPLKRTLGSRFRTPRRRK
ncbi:MAG: DEAD/DEAH box helicase [Phycisphaerae bacterium]